MHFTRHFLIVSLGLLPALAIGGGEPDDLGAADLGAAKQAASSSQAPVVANDSSVRQSNSNGTSEPVERFIQVHASDKAAEVTYEYNGSVLGFRNSRASASVLFNEDRDNVLIGSILYDTQALLFPGLDLTFGLKTYAGLISTENFDIFGLAGSIEAGYTLPVQKFPLRLSAAINYAPDIFTFGQSDRIIDWNVRVGLPLTEYIDGFVGFRFLQFDTRPGDDEIDDQLHIGIRYNLSN